MKTLLILGAGTGGTLVANKLARRLDPRNWQILVVDRDERHLYQPGLLFIPFGIYSVADVLKPKRRTLSGRVKVLFGEVELIEPAANRVKLAGRTEPIAYDQLVIALGCDIAPEETPGLNEGGWRRNIFDFYTLQGAKGLCSYLRSWSGGRLVVNVAEMPIKCPVAPLEFLFLADWFFQKRNLRNRVELVLATPLSGAFTKPKAAAALSSLLKTKGIEVVPEFAVSDVEPAAGKLISYDNKEIRYDLLVSIPVNKGAEVIGRSGMGDELNYVETNPQTLQSRNWPDVWAIGDASNVPTAKAGSVAHFMGEVLVENLCRHIRGEPLHAQFDGHANCFIESGFGRALLIDYSYKAEPLPGRYPSRSLGPFPLLKESSLNHWGKLALKWMYWHLLLPGHLPLPVKYRPPG
jgi:sulfide:quinone oxidoreductase